MITSLPRYTHFFVALSITATSLLALSGCNNVTPHANNQVTTQPTTTISPAVQAVIGDYASEDYAKRTQGYDWVGIIVSAEGNEQIAIKVRARSDVKKPTCHFDAKATLMGQDDAHGIIFQSKVNDSNDSAVFFQFKDDKLTIDSQEQYALNYFCSGGGTIVGEYQKLAGDLELNYKAH